MCKADWEPRVTVTIECGPGPTLSPGRDHHCVFKLS